MEKKHECEECKSMNDFYINMEIQYENRVTQLMRIIEDLSKALAQCPSQRGSNDCTD